MGAVLITGCSSGFGLEAALAFARRGHTTVATMRDLAKAGTLQDRAGAEGLEIDLESLDVTDDESVRKAVEAVLDRHGTVDVLVNNAGVGYDGPVECISLDAAQALMDTNFWGPVRMTQAVLPSMRQARSGVVINVSSLSGRIPGNLYGGMYSASKHALGALSESLQAEVDPFGVRVVVIEPGFFATSISDNTSAAFDDPASGTAYEADRNWFRGFMEQSVRSGADPAIVADAIVAAATDTGTPLHVPVGDDAAMFLDLWAQTGTFEAWMDTALPIVEDAVGPRPLPD